MILMHKISVKIEENYPQPGDLTGVDLTIDYNIIINWDKKK